MWNNCSMWPLKSPTPWTLATQRPSFTETSKSRTSSSRKGPSQDSGLRISETGPSWSECQCVTDAYRYRRRTLTSPGSTLGTIAYTSPEQARGEERDARKALGIVANGTPTLAAPMRRKVHARQDLASLQCKENATSERKQCAPCPYPSAPF